MEEQGRRINVLLVEDDRLVFEGLSLLLADEADMKVVGVATTAGEAVEKAQLLVPDVVLIDYHLPTAMAPRRLSGSIRSSRTSPPCSSPPTPPKRWCSAPSRRGHRDMCPRRRPPRTSSRASGGPRTANTCSRRRRSRDWPSRAGDRSCDPASCRAPSPGSPLSSRTWLRLMAKDLANPQIADSLQLGRPAVRGHVRRILEKLGTHSKAQALTIAREAGLIEL